MNKTQQQMVSALFDRVTGAFDPANPFAEHSLAELAKSRLEQAGQSTDGSTYSIQARALTNSDFPATLAGLVSRGAKDKEPLFSASFERISDIGYLRDFKPAQSSRMTAAPVFGEIEAAEIPHAGAIVEGAESAQIRSYGLIFAESRQTAVDDDVQAFYDRGAWAALGAKQTINHHVFRHLLSNPTLSDGAELFHTDRGNLLTAALDADALAAAMKSLRNLSDSAGTVYGLVPSVLLVPPSLERTAAALVKDIAAAGHDRLELVTDGLLEDSGLTGNSSTAWYLLPAPEVAPVIRVLAIEGQRLVPQIATQVNLTAETIEFKALLDFGVTTASARAIKSTGAA